MSNEIQVGPPAQPEIPPALTGHLSRVAVLHEPTPETQDPSRYLNLSRADVAAEQRGRLELATGAVYERAPELTVDSIEKSEALAAIRSTLVDSVSGARGEKPDWATAATDLYDMAIWEDDEHQRDTKLVSAVIASQFAEEPKARIDFLRRVYADGQAGRIAEACSRSHLVLVFPETKQDPGETAEDPAIILQPLSGIGQVFEASDEHMTKYLDIVERKNPGGLNRRRVHSKLVKGMRAGTHDYSADHPETERAILDDELVTGPLMDRHKLERIALQEHFLHRQEAVVFGNGDVRDAPYVHELAKLRQTSNNLLSTNPPFEHDGFMLLIADAEQALENLSQPIIAQYSLKGVDTSTFNGLTEEQAANLRFRQITGETATDIQIAHFIDLLGASERMGETNLAFFNFADGRNIWDVAARGSTMPLAAGSMVMRTKEVAQWMDPPPSAEELRDLVHSNRRELMLAAAKNIESDSPQLAGRVLLFSQVRLKRNEAGVLEYEGLLVPPGKSDFDVLAAATLGCPALRVGHEGSRELSAVEQMAHGNGIYFDHLAAAIINEAYARGIFNPDWSRWGGDPWL